MIVVHRFFRASRSMTGCLLAAGICLLALSAPSRGADDSLTPELDRSINRGLAFLVKQQNINGSFDGGGPRCAMTGLALMSYLACGHTPDVGRYGPVVRSAIDFLLKQQPDDGYFGKIDGSRMYGHGIITLALAEAYGVETTAEHRAKIREQLIRALRVITEAQDVNKDANNAGGWRYERQSPDSDLSLSGWMALSLRACQNTGLAVPKERITRATQYVMKCYRADQKAFGYQPNNECSVPMTGVAVLNLYLLDAADRPELPLAAKFLADRPITEDTRFAYYAFYYSTQAAYQAGDTVWPTVWKRTRDFLLQHQSEDGGWPASRTGEEPGRIYATTMSLLALSVPYRLLPIYQR